MASAEKAARHYRSGLAAYREGRRDEAVRRLRRAVDLAPANAGECTGLFEAVSGYEDAAPVADLVAYVGDLPEIVGDREGFAAAGVAVANRCRGVALVSGVRDLPAAPSGRLGDALAGLRRDLAATVSV